MVETHDGNEPKKQLETARGGSGGRRTAVGSGEGGNWGDGGDWNDDHFQEPFEEYQQPSIRGGDSAIICEPDDQLRAGFQCIFRPVVPIFGDVSNTERAWELILRYDPTLVICSSGPGVFELCKRIRDERFDKRISVLILTDTFGGTRYFNRLVTSGARGVVLKSSEEDELRDAARILMHGGLYCDSRLATLLARREVTMVNGVNLSPVEANVLVRLNLADDEIRRELNISQEILLRIFDRIFEALKVKSRADAQLKASKLLGKLGLIQLPQLVKMDPLTGESEEEKQARLNCERAIAQNLTTHD